MKKLLLGFVAILTIASCKKNAPIGSESNTMNSNLTNENRAKTQFAIILSKAIEQDADLRQFIKSEALLKFDKDYDVFYPFIKDKEVSNGQTFREKLAIHAENQQQLSNIEATLPLLTIYVPTLPSGFSPDSWETIEDVPAVSAAVINNKRIDFLRDGKSVISLNTNEVPGFPTLIVKNNERVKVNNDVKLKSNLRSSNLNSYAFIDDAFDGTIKLKGDPGGETNHLISFGANEVKAELVNAFDIMGISRDNWQRDHIYYGLTPSNTEGALDVRFRETIRSIRFTQSAINKMMDQNDPTFPNVSQYHGENYTPYWTEGNFEIKFDVMINNLAGLGTTITKYVQINPNIIFNLQYTKHLRPGWQFFKKDYRYIYILEHIYTNRHGLDIPLVNWDLQTNGTSWKIFVSEIDDQQTTTRTESTTTEFAANFGFNIELGKTTKRGLNFGASAKIQKLNSYSVVTQLNSDDLGTLELNFYDPVILKKIGSGTLYDMYSIYNSYVELVIMPKAAY